MREVSFSDQELQLSDDEYVEEEPVIDYEELKRQKLEAARLEKLEQDKALHRAAAEVVKGELDLLMEAANQTRPKRKVHQEKTEEEIAEERKEEELKAQQQKNEEESAMSKMLGSASDGTMKSINQFGKSIEKSNSQKMLKKMKGKKGKKEGGANSEQQPEGDVS